MARRLRSEAHPSLFDHATTAPAPKPVELTSSSARSAAASFLSVANAALAARKPARAGLELEHQEAIDALPDYSVWINASDESIRLDLSVGEQPRGKFQWTIRAWDHASMRSGIFDALIARTYSARMKTAPDVFVSLLAGGEVADAFLRAPDRAAFAFLLHTAFWHDRITRYDANADAYVFTPRGEMLIERAEGKRR